MAGLYTQQSWPIRSVRGEQLISQVGAKWHSKNNAWKARKYNGAFQGPKGPELKIQMALLSTLNSRENIFFVFFA